MRKDKCISFWVLIAIVVLSGCSKPKKIFVFETMIPGFIQGESALQKSIDYPPFLRPDGKRDTIHPSSQYFALAVLNAIDISGRSQDIQKSVADMLYTELFAKKRFNLLDRGELVDVNPEWFVWSLKENLNGQKNTIKLSSIHEDTVEQRSFVSGRPNFIDSTVEYLKMQGNTYEKMYDGLLGKVDGVLLMYITSRKGSQRGGIIGMDYRIVNRIPINIGNLKEVVLFAGKANVRYNCSSRREIEINRDDIHDIAKKIVDVFPKPQSVENSQIVKRDQRRIVINKGTDKGIIPGLFGYAAFREESVFIEEGGKIVNPRHLAYLAKFVVTEVYEKTSTALLLYPPEIDTVEQMARYNWDVKVGDSAVIK